MKKFLIFLFVSIVILFSSLIAFLSFYGYQTDRFNKIIQSEINNGKKEINLEFDEISILLDIKKLTLFVKFINPEVEYNSLKIPLEIFSYKSVHKLFSCFLVINIIIINV